jgi:hypothetical protein
MDWTHLAQVKYSLLHLVITVMNTWKLLSSYTTVGF